MLTKTAHLSSDGTAHMRNTSRDYSKKLLQIRKAEGMTQKKFAEIIGVSLGTVQKYETGQQPARSEVMEKILNVKQFEKYLMWLTINKTAPESGQIAPTLPEGQASKVKSDGIERKTEEVVAQISSQKPDMQAIISSLSNLDDDEIQQLSRLLSRRGAMFLLELLEPDNQTLIGLEGDKKQAALQLESMNKEQVREILSKIEGNNRQFTEDINDFIEKAS